MKRRLDFSAGRWCARRALAALGYPPIALPMTAAGRPSWPPGVSGSISHAEGLCGAVVTASGRRIGLDLESLDFPLDPDSEELVFGPEELRILRRRGTDRAWSALSSFSAKEAFLKALDLNAQARFDFRDVRCEISRDRSRFSIRWMTELLERGPVGGTCQGTLGKIGRHIQAFIVL